MTKEELAMERNEVREILEDFSEELSQINLDKLSRVFCLINGDEKRIADLEKENAELKNQLNKVCGIKGCMQLTKAKKIIKDLCGMVRELNKPNVQLTNVDYSLSEAEQFISEIGK